MHMQVEHGLAGASAVIHVQAEVLQPLLSGDLTGHQQQMPKQCLIGLFSIGQLGNRLLGNHQKMGRRLGIDIPEGQALVVFEDDIGRNLPVDDLGEKRFSHNWSRLGQRKSHGGTP